MIKANNKCEQFVRIFGRVGQETVDFWASRAEIRGFLGESGKKPWIFGRVGHGTADQFLLSRINDNLSYLNAQ